MGLDKKNRKKFDIREEYFVRCHSQCLELSHNSKTFSVLARRWRTTGSRNGYKGQRAYQSGAYHRRNHHLLLNRTRSLRKYDFDISFHLYHRCIVKQQGPGLIGLAARWHITEDDAYIRRSTGKRHRRTFLPSRLVFPGALSSNPTHLLCAKAAFPLG